MILLDTHVLLWLVQGHARLGPSARQSIDAATPKGELCVSAICWWEIGMLQHKGRISLSQTPQALRQSLLHDGLEERIIDGESGLLAAALMDFHGDPADRLIVATALQLGATLVTADRRILDWGGSLRRLDATA